jgi:glycosyltransferase involved in cell wall biosynthesis
MRALYVANKRLPGNDYRIVYPAYSAFCSVCYVLPERPPGVRKVDFVEIGFGEGIHLADFFHLLELWVYLRNHRKEYDFVHFYATTLILFGPSIAAFTGLPCLITLTGFGRTFNSQVLKYRLLRPVYNLFLRIASRISHAVLFQNHADLALMEKRIPSASGKFFYVGSAIDACVTAQKDFASRNLRVLLIARLLPEKGIEDFLRVAKLLHQDGFEFVLVGPSSVGFEALLSRVRASHSDGTIEYLGELDAEGVQVQYHRAHVLFFPSFYGEGMSRVMLEAGFASLCPVAYDIPSNRDLIAPNRGCLIPKRDIDEVVRILKLLKNDRSQLEQNADAYQKFVVENFNIQTYTKRLDDILAKLFSPLLS